MDKPKMLELFSGTHSFGKVLHERFDIISLDRDLGTECPFGSGYESKNHIKEDIMTWNYKIYPSGYFKVITASPSCFYWSPMLKVNYGKKLKRHGGETVFTEEILEQDIENLGKPMVDKVMEIMDYFNPTYWVIENPFLSSMKYYISDLLPFTDTAYCRYGFTYKKPTRFWTNIPNKLLKCNHKKHAINACSGQGGGTNRLPRYKIPPLLIKELFRNI